MSKDTVIARHVYFAAPSTYQMAHYSDWIRYYLEYQKGDVERSNSFAYFKFKYDAIIKALEYLRKFESEQVEKFKEEEQARMEKDLEEDKERFTQDVQKDWLAFNHNEVITHYPPLMIIGKQTQDDVTLQTHDEDPLVKVTLSEVACEYNFSNPTGYFNLSIPHIEIKTNNFQTLSYAQYRQNLYESERKEAQDKLKAQQAEEAKKAAEANQSTENTDNADVVQENAEAVKDPQDEEQKATENIVDDGVPVELKAPEVIVRNWFECKREGPVLVKVSVTNREKKKVKAAVRFQAAIEGQDEYELNVRLPKSEIKVTFFDADTLVVLHMTKINPLKPIGQIKIIVRSTDISPIPTAPPLTGGAAVAPAVRNAEVPMQVIINLNSVGSGGEIVVCDECNHRNYQGMQYCEKCGESLPQMGTNVIDNYYTTGGAYGNSMY
ncbi:hypothetical protein FGO68_gene13466 [Halteria grandinella]|uniref:Uncharacterized protein n=1 Tax=Halteria grandinella TaxID=5974 RepID=A0A8J8SW87_HALGN|nr:hypothetical protein FGO68_gene13466 [Halteria grandinella]